ncbi:MAG: hypothetical protein AAGJ46_19935 [Planctomycetota bacterium]
MDREELLALIRKGPIRITMNDGRSYDVPNMECCLVSQISISVLVKSEGDGKWRQHHLPLVTIAGIEELQEA